MREFTVECVYESKDKLGESPIWVEEKNSIFWLDTGTHSALTEASNFIRTIEKREGKKISCLEEIAFKYKFIDSKKLNKIILNYNNLYGDSLKKLVENE